MLNALTGFLIIDKERGLTSHDCIKYVRKIFNTKKVGHAGTLDPNVSGVLPIAIGTSTRLIKYLPKDKTYIGTIKLGICTDTDDMDGKILANKSWSYINQESLEKLLSEFVGDLNQIPPKYSSKHINGERAYKKARRGDDFVIPPKKIRIYSIQLLDFSNEIGEVKVKVECEEGTYIRSLARDIGLRMNTVACLKSLRRIKASGFEDKNAITFEALNSYNLNKNNILITPLQALSNLNAYKVLDEKEIVAWSTGQKIKYNSINLERVPDDIKTSTNNILIIINNINKLIGIGEIIDKTFIKPKVVTIAKG
tara:strand:- start:5936 stop:6865 length:930 start_codon:yes stop_codon:yes gene_type:complete